MPKDKKSGTQRKTVRFSVRRLGAVSCAMAAVCYGLVYFQDDLPTLDSLTWSPSSNHGQSAKHGLPYASILIPYNPNKGLCRLHALDNATGQIKDDGLVDCSDASAQNTVAWRSLGNAQKANEIRKSFRHQ